MGKFWWMLDLLAEVDTILINAVDHLADCGSSKPDQLSANHEILDDNFSTIPCGALWRCLVDWSRPRCLADQPLGLSELRLEHEIEPTVQHCGHSVFFLLNRAVEEVKNIRVHLQVLAGADPTATSHVILHQYIRASLACLCLCCLALVGRTIEGMSCVLQVLPCRCFASLPSLETA